MDLLKLLKENNIIFKDNGKIVECDKWVIQSNDNGDISVDLYINNEWRELYSDHEGDIIEVIIDKEHL